MSIKLITSVILFFAISTAYADPVTCEPGEVHCANSQGSTPLLTQGQGNWVKFSWQGGYTFTACVNDFGFSVYPKNIDEAIQAGIIQGLSPTNPVRIIWTFAQCTDQNCSQSKPLGGDLWVLSVDTNKIYSANPQAYQIPRVDVNYGQCPHASTSFNLFAKESKKLT